MATTKTIQPTGATITIPAFTDQPDARVFSTDVDNITEAVNSTNQALSNVKDSLYTAYSNSWVSSFSVNLPKQGAYLFVSQRYTQMTILMRFQNGNTTASNVSGNNWTFTNGTNGNITATASNQADYYIIPLFPTM